jgi:hypothetical protein
VPHTVVFGLLRGEGGELLAHAWVTVATVTVTGGSVRDWTPVGSFSWRP